MDITSDHKLGRLRMRRDPQVYENLYTSKSKLPSDLEDYFKSLPVDKKIDNDAVLKCEGHDDDLEGIITEFYEAFWPVLNNLFSHLFTEKSCDTVDLLKHISP